MGEGTEGNFRAASIFFFWLCLIFPTEERFRENPGTSLEEKKLKQKFYGATLLARE